VVVLLLWVQIQAYELMDSILNFLKNTNDPTSGNRFLGWVSKLRKVLKQLRLYGVARSFLDILTCDDDLIGRDVRINNAKSVKAILRPVDFDRLRDLLTRNAHRAHAFAGQDIAVLLGTAGAGKSTTVGYLGGVSYKSATSTVGHRPVMEPVDPGVRCCRVVAKKLREESRLVRLSVCVSLWC
jgi:hypothetical protein